jgi:glucan phosphoethanolaminetransferase (alkaline phosphatase superfamily)
MIQIFRYIPLMAVVLGAYNVALYMWPDLGPEFWQRSFLTFKLPSEGMVTLNFSHIIIAAALGVLFIEIVKSTSASQAAMIEQSFSIIAFVAFLIQFFVSPRSAEPTFFLLMVISLVEVLAGFIILVKVARRDIAFGG